MTRRRTVPLVRGERTPDPAGVEAEVLLGHVLVLWSGVLFSGAHSDHRGAWLADPLHWYWGNRDDES